MDVYTQTRVLAAGFSYIACFVGDAVFRAGDGCLSLAI